MDPRSLPMYQHPRMSMMGQSHISPVPGSIPINISMSIPAHGDMGIPEASMSDNTTTFTHKTHLNKMPVQQHYAQLPLRREIDDEPVQQHYTQFPLKAEQIYKESFRDAQEVDNEPVQQHYAQLPLPNEVDDDGRICGLVQPETSVQPPIEEKYDGIVDYPQQKIKTEEEEDIDNFMEAAHDIFLKISSKEITLKAASEKLGRPYSFVYTRFQEFCDNITGDTEMELPEKKRATTKKRKKKRRPKKLTITKGKPRGGKLFQCEECPANFYTEYLIKVHAKVHEKNNESHTCTACGVVFPKLVKLMRHRIEFHEEALQCPHCDSQFTIIASYNYHVRAHTGVKPFVCNECGKGFYSRFNLQCHHRQHTGEKPFMCGYCEKTFSTLNNLKIHQYVHTGGRVKKLECKQCGKRYQFKSALQEHMNIHTGAKPYACELCDARFNFKANFARHKMTHTGVQPHKCNVCPMAFYLSTELKSHMAAHTGLKPFKCDLCDYSCTRKHNLDFHKNTHTGETPFKCDFYGCTAEYGRPNSLKKHKLQHGPPPPQKCKVCHEMLPDLINLKRHMMLHTGEKPLTCDQCFKVFYDPGSLKRHMYTHMYKPPGHKTKQVRQSRKNPVVKKPVTAITYERKWPPEYQVPVNAVVAENGHNVHSGHNSIAHSWTINAEDTSSQPSLQPSYHPFTASQYTNLVNSAWPSTMDPDELRRRLLSSFK